jgi:cytochrome d ubiquinol oxidase subunit I
MNELNAEYQALYGPGNYIPPVRTTFWSFRLMVGSGTLMILAALYGIVAVVRNRLMNNKLYLKLMVWTIALPFIANSTGWIMTEVGRQPWVVFGLQKTTDGVSPTVSAGMVLTSLIGFTVVYGLIAAALVYLFVHFVKKGVEAGGDLHGHIAHPTKL